MPFRAVRVESGLARVQLQDSVVRIGRPSSVVANGGGRGIGGCCNRQQRVDSQGAGSCQSLFHRNNHVIYTRLRKVLTHTRTCKIKSTANYGQQPCPSRLNYPRSAQSSCRHSYKTQGISLPINLQYNLHICTAIPV